MAGKQHVDTPDQARWRAALDRMGPDVVRQKLADPRNPLTAGGPMLGFVENPQHPNRGFIEEWLAEKEREADRRDSKRFYLLLGLTIASTLFAFVAAIEGLK